MSFKEKVKIKSITLKVEKFIAKDSKEIEEKGIEPYEVIEKTIEHTPEDCLLNEGLENLIELICGLGTPTAWDNTNARIGVGNSGVAPVKTQTGLQGASQLYKGMNATYPQKLWDDPDWKSVFQADFVDGEAEWAWLEEAIDNGSVAALDLCRQNTDLGTKPTGQTWRITGTITWS